MKIASRQKNRQKGFTLVEMIVSLGIFTIVALVAVGALLKITDANKKSQTLKTTINNVNFALESMSREIKMGTDYRCDSVSSFSFNKNTFTAQECPVNLSSGWVIAFRSHKTATQGANSCNLIFAYKFTPGSGATFGKLEKDEQSDCNDNQLSTFAPVISDSVNLTLGQLKVAILNSVPYRQPYVWFRFQGYSGAKGRTQSTFDIQTSASQRNIAVAPAGAGGGSGGGSTGTGSVSISHICLSTGSGNSPSINIDYSVSFDPADTQHAVGVNSNGGGLTIFYTSQGSGSYTLSPITGYTSTPPDYEYFYNYLFGSSATPFSSIYMCTNTLNGTCSQLVSVPNHVGDCAP